MKTKGLSVTYPRDEYKWEQKEAEFHCEKSSIWFRKKNLSSNKLKETSSKHSLEVLKKLENLWFLFSKVKEPLHININPYKYTLSFYLYSAMDRCTGSVHSVYVFYCWANPEGPHVES